MVKSYIAESVIPSHKWDEFMKKGSTRVTVDDLHSGGSIMQLHFNKLKHLNEYQRKLSQNKAFRMTKDKIKDIVGQDGGSILTPLLMQAKKIGDKIGKPFEKTVQINPFTAGYDFGHDVVAPALMKAGIGPKPPKGGKVSVGKKIEKALKSIGHKAGKSAVKEAKNFAKNNKDELRAIGSQVASTAVSSALGETSSKDFGKSLGSAVKSVGHVATKHELERAGIFGEHNPYQYGQYKPADETIMATEGSGIIGVLKKTQKKALQSVQPAIGKAQQAFQPALSKISGGAVGQQQTYGLGGKRLSGSFQTAKERMAHARSFKKGGSLGGSFAPL